MSDASIEGPARTMGKADRRRHSHFPPRWDAASLNTIGKMRRNSEDHTSFDSLTFQLLIANTRKSLLAQEDTDGDGNITVDDVGPKTFRLGSETLSGLQYISVQGNYLLSNLLQELVIKDELGLTSGLISGASLTEDPVQRVRRRIEDTYWPNLTRRMDCSLIGTVAQDDKDWTTDKRPRIYVPRGAVEQFEYYRKHAQVNPSLKLEVLWLPEGALTQETAWRLSAKPGVLSLAMCPGPDGLTGLQYVVPGGRFNEFYGWDSYFCALGLLECGRVDLVEDIASNFCFEIENYGCILNANRTYYLGRAQPPFLTDLAVRLFRNSTDREKAKSLLREMIRSAIKEYHTVWMCEPRLDVRSGLSRYRPTGFGIPPETEESHFDHVLGPIADKHDITVDELKKAYNDGSFKDPCLDAYFLHDRAVRESGHDTCYRFEGVAADLATIDLNSLLYKYETDIAWVIKHVFNDQFEVPTDCDPFKTLNDSPSTSAEWSARSDFRRSQVRSLLWDPRKGMYCDYNTITRTQIPQASVTTFWAMWSGLASKDEAAFMVGAALPDFEAAGGLTCTTLDSRGPPGPGQPVRQWDYPFGWAPHQILAWDGLRRYGYSSDASRLAYRWLRMITRVASDYNGMIVEKYDVTLTSGQHKIDAEYGNQGRNFVGLAKEGFGWTNASYLYGLTLISEKMKVALRLDVAAEDIEGLM